MQWPTRFEGTGISTFPSAGFGDGLAFFMGSSGARHHCSTAVNEGCRAVAGCNLGDRL
jgi:hypothetical protein